jgi:hypothetical protein
MSQKCTGMAARGWPHEHEMENVREWPHGDGRTGMAARGWPHGDGIPVLKYKALRAISRFYTRNSFIPRSVTNCAFSEEGKQAL